MNIEEVAQKLSKIDFHKDSPDDVRTLIWSISDQFLVFPLITLNRDQLIYRARLISEGENIYTEDQLSYIPPEKNTKYRRASTPCNSMFYGISGETFIKAFAGCLGETCDCLRRIDSPPKTYKLIISSWMLSQELEVMAIPNINNENKSNLFNKISKGYPRVVSNLKFLSNNNGVIDFIKLINNELTKPVNNESEYWISSIFTERILSLKNNYDGIMYESNQAVDPSLNEVYCLALKPQSVDSKLIFEKADLYTFDYQDTNTGIVPKKVCQLNILKK